MADNMRGVEALLSQISPERYDTIHSSTGTRVLEFEGLTGTAYSEAALQTYVQHILVLLKKAQRNNNTLSQTDFAQLQVWVKQIIAFRGSYSQALRLIYLEMIKIAAKRKHPELGERTAEFKEAMNDVTHDELQDVVDEYFEPGQEIRVAGRPVGIRPSAADMEDLEKRVTNTMDELSDYEERVEGLDELGYAYQTQLTLATIRDPKKREKFQQRAIRDAQERLKVTNLTNLALRQHTLAEDRAQEIESRAVAPFEDWNFLKEAIARSTGGLLGSRTSGERWKVGLELWGERLSHIPRTIITEGFGAGEGLLGGLGRLLPFASIPENVKDIAARKYQAYLTHQQTQMQRVGGAETTQQGAVDIERGALGDTIRTLLQRIETLEATAGIPPTEPEPPEPPTNNLSLGPDLAVSVEPPKHGGVLAAGKFGPAFDAQRQVQARREAMEADELHIPAADSAEEPHIVELAVEQDTGPRMRQSLVEMGRAVNWLLEKVRKLTKDDDDNSPDSDGGGGIGGWISRLFRGGGSRGAGGAGGAAGRGVAGRAAGLLGRLAIPLMAATAVVGGTAWAADQLFRRSTARTIRDFELRGEADREVANESTGMYEVPERFRAEAERQMQNRQVQPPVEVTPTVPPPQAPQTQPLISSVEPDRGPKSSMRRTLGVADQSKFTFADFQIETVIGGLDRPLRPATSVFVA